MVGNAREWWGQSLKLELDAWDQDTSDPVEAKQTRWQPVLIISLKTLLEREAIVDLVNFDCQDSEVHVIRGATTAPGDVLSKKEAENEILALLCSHGWHLVATNPISAARPGGTSFHANLILGRISKGPTDGLQIWANPKQCQRGTRIWGISSPGLFLATVRFRTLIFDPGSRKHGCGGRLNLAHAERGGGGGRFIQVQS